MPNIKRLLILNFYSRPRAGAILTTKLLPVIPNQFLLTPPGGGDQGVAIIVRKRLCKFLLTPPGGGDRPMPMYSVPGLIISTHAPGRGRSAIFHKTDIMFRGKLPKDHLLFYGIRLA